MINNNQLDIMSFNCRSIRNKVIPVLSHLSDNNIDICMLQETWLNKGDSSVIQEIKEQGYSLYSQRRLRGDTGGGVAILYKPDILVRRCNSKSKFNSFEYISCTVHTADKTFRLVNIYRTGYSKRNPFTASQFLEEFSALIEEQLTIPGELVISGDFNFRIEDTENHKDAKEFLRTVDTLNLFQHVTGITHTLGGTLDLLITASSDIPQNIVILDDRMGSDHNPISFQLKCSSVRAPDCITATRRKYRDIDLKTFKSDLSDALQPVVFGHMNSQEAVILYNNVMERILDKHCPAVKHRVKRRITSPWYTDELRDIKRVKRRYERAYKKHGTIAAKETYEKIKKKYSCVSTITRNRYYRDKLDESKKDMKSMYKTLNRVLGQEEERVFPTNNSADIVADEMAQFFSNKVKGIREIISNTAVTSPQPILVEEDELSPDAEITELLEFAHLSQEQVRLLIKDMNSKSCSLDPFPTWLLKDCIGEVLPILTHIVNSSLQDSNFPEVLKHATITPIIKDLTGDAEAYNNYRPISNTAFIAKLIEKAVLNQINWHINRNKLHSVSQSGYRKYHSCETATLKVVNDIKEQMVEDNISALLLLDLSAAFDTGDHDILLARLDNMYNIRQHALDWLRSYLKGRTFSVNVNGKDSKRQIMLFGVPQGSLLGPILFILYTKELESIAASHDICIHIYADDTQLYLGFKCEDSDSTKSTIENCLVDIKKWMLKNYLKLNTDKTDLIFLGKKNNLTNFSDIPFLQGNTIIESSQVVKSLGVFLDPTLSMTRDINKRCSAAYYHLRNIGRVKRCLDQPRRILLIQSLILTKLDYCNSILANVPDYLINKLQMVMNAGVRFIYDLKRRDHITPYMKQAHFLPVKYRIRYKLCLLVYKALNDQAPEYLQKMMIWREPSLRGSRDQLLLQIPTKKQKTIYHSMGTQWNELPLELRQSYNILKFKKDLKTHYFKCAYQTDSESDTDIE